jgi:hypothetical protein
LRFRSLRWPRCSCPVRMRAYPATLADHSIPHRDPIVGAQYRWSASFAPFAPRFWGFLQGVFYKLGSRGDGRLRALLYLRLDHCCRMVVLYCHRTRQPGNCPISSYHLQQSRFPPETLALDLDHVYVCHHTRGAQFVLSEGRQYFRDGWRCSSCRLLPRHDYHLDRHGPAQHRLFRLQDNSDWSQWLD